MQPSRFRIRAQARRRLGPAFSLPAFHAAVLGHDSLPMSTLGRRIEGLAGPDLSRSQPEVSRPRVNPSGTFGATVKGMESTSSHAALLAAVGERDLDAMRALYDRHAGWLAVRHTRRCNAAAVQASATAMGRAASEVGRMRYHAPSPSHCRVPTRTLSARPVRRIWLGGLLLTTYAMMFGAVGTGITMGWDLTS